MSGIGRSKTTWLAEVGEQVAEQGFQAVEPAIAEVVAAARRSQVRLASVDVLADRSASPIVRSRALAVVSSALLRVAAMPTPHVSARVA